MPKDSHVFESLHVNLHMSSALKVHAHTSCVVQVALKPYLIYSDAYDFHPPGTPKNATSAQLPTKIHGAVELKICTTGDKTIKVSRADPPVVTWCTLSPLCT